MLASGYPLLDVMWTIFVVFAWVIWFWCLVMVFGDLFRRHDVSGWAKAAWTVFVLFLPFLGTFTYLIAQGRGMAERRQAEAQVAQSQFDDYVRSVATTRPATSQPAEQIARAQELLDSGAITRDEFESLKQKALTG